MCKLRMYEDDCKITKLLWSDDTLHSGCSFEDVLQLEGKLSEFPENAYICLVFFGIPGPNLN